MSAQWKGADTGSFTARFAPLDRQSSEARSTAAAWPAITTWPGELTLAGETTSAAAASARRVDRGELQPEDRRHGAHAHGNRLLHVLAPAAHGPQGVAEADRPGRDEG
jgi:hypothetical protein